MAHAAQTEMTVENQSADNQTVRYEALEDVPDYLVAEMINGEIITHPRPVFSHSKAALQLATTLTMPFDRGIGGPGGWLLLTEPELNFKEQILVPDLAGWRTERAPKISGTARSSIAPDWICEVLSPSTIRYDVGAKKDIYAQFGVSYLWFVDPVMKTLQTLELDKGAEEETAETKGWKMTGYYAQDDSIHAKPFDDIILDLKWLWDEDKPEEKS